MLAKMFDKESINVFIPIRWLLLLTDLTEFTTTKKKISFN